MVAKLALLAAAGTAVSAQTSTSCNPTLKTCPNDPAFGAGTQTADFKNDLVSDVFTPVPGTTITYDATLGADFKISNYSDAPTMESTAYIFYGQVDVVLRTAPGQGIVSSIVLQSDDLDEIDWEFLGGYPDLALVNYFSKGCTEVYDRGANESVNDAQNTFHTYTLKWTKEQLDWIIDGVTVHTLVASTVSGCDAFPQTPMKVKIGTWIGGNPAASVGTQEWAGGLANMADGPFHAYYQSVTIQDAMGGATSASAYEYTDNSGTSDSIKVIDGSRNTSSSSSSPSSSSTQYSTKTATLTTAVSPTSSSRSKASGSESLPSSTSASGFTSKNSGSGSAVKGATAQTGVVGVGAALLALFAFL